MYRKRVGARGGSYGLSGLKKKGGDLWSWGREGERVEGTTRMGGWCRYEIPQKPEGEGKKRRDNAHPEKNQTAAKPRDRSPEKGGINQIKREGDVPQTPPNTRIN